MLPGVELNGRSLSMAVGASDVAFLDLSHDLVPRELSGNQLRHRRKFGSAVAVVELQAPDVCLAAIDTWVLVEIPGDAQRQSGSHLARS